ncbi:MAG: hypothetical protein AAB295_12325 [Chloroflexota bacterium]
MAKKDKKNKGVPDEAPVDFATRIGGRGAPEPVVPAPPPPPAPPARTEPASRLDGPLPPRRTDARPQMIGMDEALQPPPPPPTVVPPQEHTAEESRSAAIPSPRTLPGPGEMDLVVTPIPTLDDWHRFELALRRLRGIGQVRTEYYRHGALKLRVSYDGPERLAQALRAGIPGYRVRVLGEDRSTIQLSVSSDNDERRPG